jgi:serine/threonine protein kinase
MNGNTINGYKILRMLGSGGMADVYFAENILEMPAAIKVLKKKYYDDKSIRDRFKNEALIMKSLDHPNIRKVIDYFENDGYAMIVMEFVEGMTLKDLMDVKKTISDETMHKYFEQCISALNYTHSRGIVHRDIKPSNIFITTAGDVKLVDYGIAKSDSGNSHTMTGQTLGTIIYMSPEQIIDPKRVTYKTDIYSMGVTFYQALIGKPPYDAKTGSEFTIQQKIVYENLDLTIIPIHWRSKLESCLRKKAEDRSMPMHTSKGDTIVDTPLPPPPPPQLTTNSKWIYYILGGYCVSHSNRWIFCQKRDPRMEITEAYYI